MKIKQLATAISFALASLASTALLAQAQNENRNVDVEQDQEWEGEARDAWIDGKLEGSYLVNSELNNFRINTHVENGAVILTGSVESEVDRTLAEEIAKNLDGVVSVDNQLTIGETEDVARDDNDRKFSTAFFDMTTTARLKSRYAVEPDLSAVDINIDTRDSVVVLEGEVESEAEKQLAEEIAQGYDYVTRVENRLQIAGE